MPLTHLDQATFTAGQVGVVPEPDPVTRGHGEVTGAVGGHIGPPPTINLAADDEQGAGAGVEFAHDGVFRREHQHLNAAAA
jgi:hypothetical protein